MEMEPVWASEGVQNASKEYNLETFHKIFAEPFVVSVDKRIHTKSIAYYSINSLMLAIAHNVYCHSRRCVPNKYETWVSHYMAQIINLHEAPNRRSVRNNL